MSENRRTAGIYTLGCKVNQYESEAIAEQLEARGFEILSPASVCDAYVINTCTVTAESDRKARQFIRRAISKNPNAAVIVTGCMAQTAPSDAAAIEGVSAVIGNTDKLSAARVADELVRDGVPSAPIIRVDDINEATFESMSITHFERTRAYVKIEDGCESRCTYCIIPAARGKIRSKLPTDVVREVSELIKNGCREVVLTGIETASYGKDLGDVDLADLLCRVDKLEGIGRVRLGSLDPSLIKEDFVKRISTLRSLAPHFHLSLQSGSSKVLADMKRKYNADMAMRAIELLRRYIPRAQFTTDIIVGFPGESEQDFEETLDFMKRAGFLMTHVFPYSKRAGTPAATMQGQIPKTEKTRRLHILEKAEADIRDGILRERIARQPIAEVLFETLEDGYATGHTDDFIEVRVPADTPMHALIGRVRLLDTDGTRCTGILI